MFKSVTIKTDTNIMEIIMKNEKPQLQYIDIDLIDPDPDQPRRKLGDVTALASDMATNGQHQPITVISTHPRYRIVDGERRWRGAKARKETKIHCLVVDLTPEKIKASQFSANFFRKQFSPFEEADEYKRLLFTNSWTQDELAKYLGEPRTKVTETITLSKIPADIQKRLSSLPQSAPLDSLYRVAKAKDHADMEQLASMILDGATVREVRNAAKVMKYKKHPKPKLTLTEIRPSQEETQQFLNQAPTHPVDKVDREVEMPAHIWVDADKAAVNINDEIKSETIDEQIVRIWWDAYTVYVVHMNDIKHLNIPLKGKAFEKWLRDATGKIFSGRKIVIKTAAVNKFVYQLIPVEFIREIINRKV